MDEKKKVNDNTECIKMIKEYKECIKNNNDCTKIIKLYKESCNNDLTNIFIDM
jgi:hypothetical protein